MVATNNQKYELWFSGINTATNLFLNVILVPYYGITGASIASLVSYSSGLFLSLLIPKTKPYSIIGFQNMFKPIIASLIMAGFLYFTKSHLVISLITSIIVFTGTLALIKGIDKRDINLCLRIFSLKTETSH